MSLLKKKIPHPFIEAIDILEKIKEKITDGSDCIWTSYENGKQIRDDIDKYILAFQSSSTKLLDETYSHFIVTSTYQEHSMSNGWSDEYLKFAEKFDGIYEALKTSV